MQRLAAVLVPLLAAGCVNIHYAPDVTLGVSPVTIDARVRFDGVRDESPEEDREPGFFDEVSATHPESLDGDLGLGVTNAVLRDFRDNRVFREIAKRIDKPDLVLQGRIVRFTGKSGLNTGGVITAPFHYVIGTLVWYLDIWYLGFYIQHTRGEVELAFDLRRPDGPVVGSWSARRSFTWSHSYYNAERALLSLPTEMNRMLNEVVQEIRDGMVGDRARLEAPWQK